MNPLEEKIIERIKKEGPITFEAFMDMALYYPRLGYYSSGKTIIGKTGDFYTSPHLHPIFGAMLARQLMEMWDSMGKPSLFHAVEMGAGAGYLCKDILDYLHRPSIEHAQSQDKIDFLKSLKYVIVERDPYFEEKQRELIREFSKDITWIRSLRNLIDKYVISAKAGIQKKNWIPARARNDVTETSSESITGCIFSNELLDAFPVHLVEMEDELKEIYIDFHGGEFVEVKGNVSSAELTSYLKEFSINLQTGYRTEINLRIKDWLKEVNAILSQGFILTIDYGHSDREYYSEERTKGTLLCYHRHKTNENPRYNIGEQDITAHVNFSSLKKWGEEHGLKTIGYCPQGTFLIASGIDEVIMELYPAAGDYPFEMTKIKGLIFPQGMGETHNVMIQYKGENKPKLRGFSIRNHAVYL
jgi:SAM-dependent MidA family methyltransferase